MILADTSAWLEYDRATGSTVDKRLTDLIDTGGPLLTTEPVLMEVLAGAHDAARADDLRRLLLRGGLLPFDATTDFEAAARIYRRCSEAGIIGPRNGSGMIDCMVTAVAWRCGAALLTYDVDLDRVARLIGVELDGAIRRG